MHYNAKYPHRHFFLHFFGLLIFFPGKILINNNENYNQSYAVLCLKFDMKSNFKKSCKTAPMQYAIQILTTSQSSVRYLICIKMLSNQIQASINKS